MSDDDSPAPLYLSDEDEMRFIESEFAGTADSPITQ